MNFTSSPQRRMAPGAARVVQHPIPSAESLPTNVEKLEASAEKLSSSSRDVGEEIRRMSAEQKRQQSGHSSTSPYSNRMRSITSFPLSSPIDETSLDFPAHLISDSHASQHESPFAHSFVHSPRGSVRSKRSRSGSGSQRSLRSTSHSTRLPQLPEPEQEGRPLDSPLTQHLVPATPTQPHEFESMFSTWHQPVAEHDDRHDNQEHHSPPAENPQTRQLLEGSSRDDSRLGGLHRNASTASRSTYVPASLFRDFDGVHYTSVSGGISEEARSVSGRDTPSTEQDHDQLPPPLPEPKDQWVEPPPPPQPRPKNQWTEPPPDSNMVYYPAPVPMTLNLPKRLSQQPTAAAQAQRRSQVLSAIPLESRKSALWLGRKDAIEEEHNDTLDDEAGAQNQLKQRQSQQEFANLQKLPPQLRASVFFDHTPVSHNLEVKNGSAMATLESMLDESARAPIGEGPLPGAGPGRKHKARRSTVSLIKDMKSEVAKSDGRQSRVSLFSRPRSSTDKISQLRTSSYSRLSMTSEHDEDAENRKDGEESSLLNSPHEGVLNDTESHVPGRVDSEHGSATGSEGEDRDEEDSEEEEEENDPVAELNDWKGAPTTLLAELQLRKHQLRQRNRTAVTAYPNGMHSTLLELDAVAQIERKKRNAARTTLAWEDPKTGPEQEKDDDDVPLGMLFPEHNGLLNKKRGADDWDRPLGLIEKRELEDNEPLSRRRNRLKGIDPRKVALEAQAAARAKQEEQDAAEYSEHEGETLAERTRRLKTKKALDDAIGTGVEADQDPSADFTTDIMSQFGDLEKTEQQSKTREAAKKEPVEETLGQRRRRLQAEANATANGEDTSLPPLRSSQSLANILSAHPLTALRNEPKSAQLSGLVGQSEQQRANRRQDLMERNQRSGTNFMDGPLVDIPKVEDPSPNLSKFAAGKTNDGIGGVGLQGLSQPQLYRSTTMPMQNINSNQVDFTTGLLAAQQHISASQQVANANALAQQFAQISGHMSAYFPQTQQTPLFLRQSPTQQQGPQQLNFVQPSFMPQQPLQNNLQHLSSIQNQNISHQSLGIPGYAAPGMYPGYSQTASMMQGTSPMMMTPKQRENIDRWRQSIM